ncbi:MAG: beta-ketoacyl synthase chain length factor [Rhodospirillaceae bacterium]|nr:beta-ketoacyl synthase chain length factor [Rhodospirillaceae bacterium]
MIAAEPASLKSSGKLSIIVRDWFAWTPGRETRGDWLDWAGRADARAALDQGMPVLPMMLRRRATSIGQKALGAALACTGVSEARFVLASRHGEYDRTALLLASLADEEPPSPADFSMSVHHGLVGLLSIHTGNRLGHTAVASSLDSFGYGLLEAASCLEDRPDIPVLFLYFDAPLPEPYVSYRLPAEANLPLVLALLLTAGDGDRISIDCAVNSAGNASDSLPEAFLKFLLTNAPAATATGEQMTWRWDRAA